MKTFLVLAVLTSSLASASECKLYLQKTTIAQQTILANKGYEVVAKKKMATVELYTESLRDFHYMDPATGRLEGWCILRAEILHIDSGFSKSFSGGICDEHSKKIEAPQNIEIKKQMRNATNVAEYERLKALLDPTLDTMSAAKSSWIKLLEAFPKCKDFLGQSVD